MGAAPGTSGKGFLRRLPSPIKVLLHPPGPMKSCGLTFQLPQWVVGLELVYKWIYGLAAGVLFVVGL